MKNLKHIITTLTFLAALYAVFFLNLFKAPDDFSVSERRRLAQFPAFTLETIRNGTFMEGFDKYAVDQAAFREPFRRLKAVFDLNVLRKMDNNNIFVLGDMVFKTEYPLNERSVLRLCGIINTVYDRLLGEAGNVYYTVVPDKNAYLENSGHLVMDYAALERGIRDSLDGEIEYIRIFDDLSLDCYFRTDSHWKQDKIIPAAQTLADGMGVELSNAPYTKERFDRFYGVYYGQSALNIAPDELVWLESDATRQTIVTSMEKPGQKLPVYDQTQLESPDPYNLFMCGSAAIVTAQNPLNGSGRRLILFRDSYAAALSPLLLDGYSEIVLIDLRYVSPDTLGQFVDFVGADVLFIYSSTLFNASDSIRGLSAETFVSPFVARERIN
ncbi:MAG: DHHW family protein [Oscillospiraceae bacterium]|nr:DHHW family protein [Oscillospiraceae bacterium]